MEQKHKTETMTRTIALKQIGTPRLVIRPLNEEDVKAFIIKRIGKNDFISGWLRKEKKIKSQNGQETKSNEDLVQSEFGCWINRDTVPSAHSYLLVDQPIRGGIIITEPDKYGFFKVRNNYNDEDELWCVIGDHGAPSLYRGSLVF